MSDEPVARRAMRLAERGTRADASRLVAAVPGMLREARRRRGAEENAPSWARLATWALPRLAIATAVAVVAATSVWLSERPDGASATAAFESAIVGADDEATGDALFDALFGLERNDG